MTKAEYAEYQGRVARYLEGLEAVSTGPCPGCPECDLPKDAEDYIAEPFISSAPCEICGDPFQGNREPWHAYDPQTGNIVHGDCCEDCVYYLNYGRLCDVEMEAIEAPE